MRVLITGATGLIGKEVGKRLIASGHSAVAVSRNPARARFELPFPAACFEWRGGDTEFPLAALEGVEGIIHLAGEPVADSRWTEGKKRAIRDSRVLGTRRLAQAIAHVAHKPHVLIHGSAMGFYGDRGDEVLTESSAAGSGFLTEVVRDWENETSPLEQYGIRVAHMRTSLVFSRRDGALGRLIPIFSKGVGGKLASGQQWMSWIHIDDIARAFVFCLENHDAKGVINGSSPEPARNERFTIALARALGRPVFLPVPETALKAILGEAASGVLSSQRMRPQRLQELGFRFHHPELVPALEELCAPLRGGQHEYVAEQWLPQPPDELFPYFCNENNLAELTPPALGFKVLGKSTPTIRAGTRIDYRLSIHGVPVRWRTLIEDWSQGKSFVDVQVRGPYRKWHHTHEFLPMAGGTLLRDRIVYRLPFGMLGDAFAGWRVSRDVEEIFKFRRQVISQRFGVNA